MDQSSATLLRIGAWCVNPASSQISRDGEVVRVEARTMRLLLCLAERAGEVVSIDELLNQVWSGVIVTPDSVYQAVASLRRLLKDDAKQPAYIATESRLGYRMVAAVSPWTDQPITPTADVPTPSSRRNVRVLLIAGAALFFAPLVAFLFYLIVNSHHVAAAGASQMSVAVLPFLDLTTQEMNEEYFADGMTEELTDKLSKIPGLRVPAPTSSFYFKGKQVTVADIAKSLGVVYVLDGSVRKSEDKLRIAARLIRANDGFIVWSETYDRSADDKLKVQDDIASEVAKALSAAIH